MPSYLSVDDMFRLLDRTADDTLLGRRNRALFEVLYGSGIRVSELTGLKRFRRRLFKRLPAGGRAKAAKSVLYLWEKRALVRIRAYREKLLEKTGIDMQADGPLFLNMNKGRLSTRSVARILEALVPQVQPGGAHLPPRDPAQFCHPHARCRSGPENCSGVAGPQESVDHPEVHPCEY